MKKLIGLLVVGTFLLQAGAKADSMETNLAKALNDAAVLRMQKGDVAGAMEKWEESLAIDPSYGEALRNLGKVLLAGKQYEKAEKIFSIGFKKEPDDMRYVVPLSQIYALKGDMVSFGEMLSRIAAAQDRSLLCELPVLLHKQGSLHAAEIAADRAVLECPGSAECRFNKGVVAEKLGQTEVAEMCYRKAVSLKVDYFDALVNLGNVLYAKKRIDEAIKSLRAAYVLQPQSSVAQYNLGRVLVLSGRDIREGLSLLDMAQKAKDEVGRKAHALLAELVKVANGK